MPMVIVGDSKGVIRIFQVTQDRAVFIAHHELVKGIEVASSDDAVIEIFITQDE
jgi:hypothetical protein